LCAKIEKGAFKGDQLAESIEIYISLFFGIMARQLKSRNLFYIAKLPLIPLYLPCLTTISLSDQPVNQIVGYKGGVLIPKVSPFLEFFEPSQRIFSHPRHKSQAVGM